MDKQHQIIVRNAYINSLNNCISSSKKTIARLMGVLGWTEQLTVIQNEPATNLVQCSIDPTHRVLPENLNAHEEMCKWHQQGYGKDSVPFPAATTPSSGTVLLDKAKQAQIILEAAVRDITMKIGGAGGRGRSPPQTSDRLFSDFTTDERRVLYDHVVSLKRGTMPELQEFTMPVVEDPRSGPLTREQQMAMERDAKRRRVRHRALKVHTRSKKYSQVLREIINNQMAAYEDWLKAYHGAKDSVCCSHGTEKSKDVEGEKTSDSQEMKWVEWDRKCNPHLWWKRVLKLAKREEEMKRVSEMEEDRKKTRGLCDSGGGMDEVKRDIKREPGKEYSERDIKRGNEKEYYERESRDHRRDGYDRERDRYKDSWHLKRKRGHYKEERYTSREHEKRRRVYETKRSRHYSEDEEEEYLREREKRKSYKTESGKRMKNDSDEGEKERYSRREREKRRGHEGGSSRDDRSRLDERSCKISTRKGQRLENIVKDEVSSNPDLTKVTKEEIVEQTIMDGLVQNVLIKLESVDDSTKTHERSEEALIEGDSLQLSEKRQELVDEPEKFYGEPIVQRKDDESPIKPDKAFTADELLEKVKAKLENNESLDDGEVRLAQELLFKRLKIIGKEMSSSGDKSRSGNKNKAKKKKKKKSKQKIKNKEVALKSNSE